MRKWLFVLLAVALLYALSEINTKRRRRIFPLLKRINEVLNILVWVLLVVYLGAFLYWLFFRR